MDLVCGYVVAFDPDGGLAGAVFVVGPRCGDGEYGLPSGYVGNVVWPGYSSSVGGVGVWLVDWVCGVVDFGGSYVDGVVGGVVDSRV